MWFGMRRWGGGWPTSEMSWPRTVHRHVSTLFITTMGELALNSFRNASVETSHVSGRRCTLQCQSNTREKQHQRHGRSRGSDLSWQHRHWCTCRGDKEQGAGEGRELGYDLCSFRDSLTHCKKNKTTSSSLCFLCTCRSK
jgi:hypothetical protein